MGATIPGIQHFLSSQPSQWDLQFTVYSLQSVSGSIFDLSGRVVAEILDKKLPASEHRLSFDVSGLPDGIYFLLVAAGDEAVSQKLIILH